MRVLLIKTSSMGDIIHTLPAVTEAKKFIPEISFDWVVEENFSEIPLWHDTVDEVISITFRKLRNVPWRFLKSNTLKESLKTMRKKHYDFVIDAQGLLLKSALLTLISRGTSYGFDWCSAKEPLASLFYQHRFFVAKNQHAITRNRVLFAKVLGYQSLSDFPDYGFNLNLIEFFSKDQEQNGLVFVHGSSRVDKLWSENNWRKLSEKAIEADYTIYLPWGNELEKARAKRIATNLPRIHVLAKSNLAALARLFLNAKGVVSVDTGLGHLAAALGAPLISLYQNSDPNLVGAIGKSVDILMGTKEKSFATIKRVDITVDRVWQALINLCK